MCTTVLVANTEQLTKSISNITQILCISQMNLICSGLCLVSVIIKPLLPQTLKTTNPSSMKFGIAASVSIVLKIKVYWRIT